MSLDLDFSMHPDGLLPAIVQDDRTLRVLMLGYMNREALEKTLSTGRVTFWSRSRNRLWTKGEESGNFLELRAFSADCDADTLLVKAHPLGPTCHTGSDTCWGERNHTADFLSYLEEVIQLRRGSGDPASYVNTLFGKGLPKIAQKVGEESVELVIEAMRDEPDKFLGEAADLMFHYLVLLNAKGFTLQDVTSVLEKRHAS
ncbi:MAG: bifunctional phosphoribosyl-AMP cyclohydrolase/phosphoribosyl-ATP diphosphatase HisIE [Chitinophagia bacterium]|nr:bifunctional phosphoribosyl-AMP cyclohydrolase/phosphoribosyl-ATP diphosphatase HisIE [Chitinophagia bacterium]